MELLFSNPLEITPMEDLYPLFVFFITHKVLLETIFPIN